MVKNNEKPEIVFIDLDGTLLDKFSGKSHYAGDENKKILKELNKTTPIIISTGRGPTSITKQIMADLELTDYIAWNGAHVVKKGEVVYKVPISKEINKKLFETVTAHKMSIIYNSNPKETSYASSWFFKMILKFGQKSAKKYHEFKNDFDVYKVFIWTPRKKTIRRFHNELLNEFKGELNLSLSGRKNEFIEITSIGASKGLTEKWYCESLNIDPKKAIHLGDSLNDASAKNIVGLLVGFNNANEKFKKEADLINNFSHKNGGVAKYLSQFLDKE